jgi:hypothetical protein
MAMQAPTSSRLRGDIDRGRAGDKVDVADPAAAPLGTDDEAAGTPASPEAVETAHREEIRKSSAQGPSIHDSSDPGSAIYLIVMAILAAAISATIVLLI